MRFSVLSAEEIGDRIRELRRRVGLSQYELGSAAFGEDKKRATVENMLSWIETGKGGSTSFQKLMVLSSAFSDLREVPQADVLDYLEGRTDSLKTTLEVRPTLHAIEGEGKPNWGVPSSKSRSRRAPKKQANQEVINTYPQNSPDQPTWFGVAA